MLRRHALMNSEEQLTTGNCAIISVERNRCRAEILLSKEDTVFLEYIDPSSMKFYDNFFKKNGWT